MSISIKKTLIASLAALTLGLGVASTPAAAQGPGWHGGGGGWHGGGNHGGWHGGGYHGGGWHGGGRGWGPGIGLGIVGGLAAGAIIASQAPYYTAYDDDGCYRYRPTYDQWGNYLGRRLVNVCY